MNDSPLHDRLRHAVSGRSIRHVADLTGVNHESVRRYLNGQTPSVEFLTALCKALGLNAEWLVSGQGPIRSEDIRKTALRESPAPDLIMALAHTVEQLLDRVDRLERFVQTMEARVRVAQTPAHPAEHQDAAVPTVVLPPRVVALADALPKRPPPTAG